jgi:hypothetical protein
MADILFQLDTMAATARAIAATKTAGMIMSTTQSVSETINKLATLNKWLFAGYLVLLLLTVLVSWLVWNNGNKLQGAIREDAKADIEHSRALASQANERAEKLTNDNLQIRTRLRDLETELANARTRQAQAENETLRLKARIRPRSLETPQRDKLLDKLKNSPSKGAVLMHFQLGDGEGAEFALELRDVLEDAGWQPSLVSAVPYVRAYDLHVWTQNDLRPPHRANMLLGALRDADLPTRATTNDAMQDGEVALVVGFKSLYR